MVNLPPFSPSDFTENPGGWTINPTYLQGDGQGGVVKELTIGGLYLQNAVVSVNFDFYLEGIPVYFSGNPYPYCAVLLGLDAPGGDGGNAFGGCSANLIDDVLYTGICTSGGAPFRPAISKFTLYSNCTITFTFGGVGMGGGYDAAIRYQNPVAAFDHTENFVNTFVGQITSRLFLGIPDDTASSYLKINSISASSEYDKSGDALLSSRGNGVAFGVKALNPTMGSDSGSAQPAPYRLFPFEF